MLVEFDGGLRGDGELVQLISDGGVIVDQVDYTNAAPWPSDPAAGEVSLSLFDPATDNGDPLNWGISQAIGGTPGAMNDTVPGNVVPPPNVVINELHYNPAGDGAEFVELFNAEGTEVDLSGWVFDGFTFTIPEDTTIAAGGYFVATDDLVAFQQLYPGVAAVQWTSGSLSNNGEEITLTSGAGVLVDEVTYDDGSPEDPEDVWPSEPDGDGPSLELTDPSLDNADFMNWEVSLLGGSPGASNAVADVVDPVGVVAVPGPGVVVEGDGSFTVSGSAFDAESGVVEVQVRVQRRDVSPVEYWSGFGFAAGSRFVSVVPDAAGDWSLDGVDLSTPGEYRVTVRVVDGAGNLSQWWENTGASFTVA